jgi:hypothetical protein
MKNQSRSQHSRLEHRHPIRIVPLHRPKISKEDVTAAAATPKLTYRNGPLLTSVQVFTIFWGAAWQQSPLSELRTQIDQFFDFILTSQLVDQLGEYSIPGKTITHGAHIGSAVLATPAPPASVQDSAIQQFIQQQIDSGALPAPTPNTLYFVYLPEGVSVTDQGSASCTTFCGYHDSFGNNIFYAVMPYPGCSGCLGALSPLDALTSTSSHELCEAITDPVPGQCWYDDSNGEIGDICAWKTRKLGNFTIQLEWSNRSASCL